MGYPARPKPTNLYATLVHIYPKTFRTRYGTTMIQTFDDMLEHEQTTLGRLKVWARTLVDLPVSAGKEHITNGKGIHMHRNMKLVLGAAIVAIILVGAGSYWAGNLHARQSIGIERVTTAQLADAMQQDTFFSSYGSAALLFQGTVSSIKYGNSATLVTFASTRPFKVVCQFPSHISTQVGQKIAVAAPGGSAERQTAGVLLHSCTIN
jgi:hypothetical protein